jgi:hypothetical protein
MARKMKTISYVALTAWICIAGTLYGTMWVMNKVRIEDSTLAAAENLDRLVEIDRLIKRGEVKEARDSLNYFIEFQIKVSQRCGYMECISPVKDHVSEAIENAIAHQKYRNVP